MKILTWISENMLFLISLFLLAFIPLYPKLPLIDIKNTWVYIRLEDFFVVLSLVVWVVLFLRRKIRLQTPLTLPIMIFWIIGAIATIHGVLLVFPTIANVFPNVAFLSFLRRIEYISLFFVAYAGIRDKRFLPYVVVVLTTTLVLVFLYGIGQKYVGLPAYLTMNEEFAKGAPIRLSSLSRVPSTFGGHYDLAAYLVLLIPILTSLIFGVRNWFIRGLLFVMVSLGFILLSMTVSRISFFVLLISLLLVLIFHMKKLVIFSLPFVAIFALFLTSFSTNLVDRFGSSIKEVDVLVDAKTGEALGHAQVVSPTQLLHKTIIRKYFRGKEYFDSSLAIKKDDQAISSTSAVVIPAKAVLLVPPNTPTGENLPQGTGYINLTLSPVHRKVGEFLYENSPPSGSTESSEVFIYYGDFLIKRALAYDLSFTTRFQGEWPKAIEAFKKNILIGSGYSSVSLAVDNNYLRMLGETGLLGFASFLGIFLSLGIYIKKALPDVDSPMVKSFVLGFVAGIVGLAFNALFIDVFEASKVAYVLWLLTGVTIGILTLYQKKHIDLRNDFKSAVVSTYAVIGYLLIVSVVVFSPMISNFFIGDDFTWFRWAADCTNKSFYSQRCPFSLETITHYFTEAKGFFYRPGTKTYFLFMYSVFWLNQTVYHVVSIFLHFIAAVLLFLLAKKILRDSLLSALAAFLFLILSGYSEAVFWISSTGHLFNAVFILLSVLFFIAWDEKKRIIYYIACLFSFIASLLFHELGIVTPLLILFYKLTTDGHMAFGRTVRRIPYVLLFLPVIPYLVIRFFAQSHWLSGDYSYNFLKLPLNVIGNVFGYIFLTLFGPTALPFYQMLRNFSRTHIAASFIVTLALMCLLVVLYRVVIRKIGRDERQPIMIGCLFFVIPLLPFLGLGNIAPRYSYLSSAGFILLAVIFINKIYIYLLNSGREVALAGVGVLTTLFFLLHVIQIQQIHSDWYEAGEEVKRFFIAIDELYADDWANEQMEFHFVNVPIRHGEAWVFPVGLSDALWFSYQNPRIHVYQKQSVEEALGAIKDPIREKVFIFDDRGRVVERKRVLKVQ